MSCCSHSTNNISSQNHHKHMVYDFKKRFFISLILTIPILFLSPMIRGFLGLEAFLSFSGDKYLLFALSSVVFSYGGWPFLKGFYNELKSLNIGMMTLIALAIIVAYLYSSAIVFGVVGKLFFWELCTLIDVMLLGHWIEMKSVIGAGNALEELVRLMPSNAHKIMKDKSVQDISIEKLKIGDWILIKPGEKIPADGLIVEGESNINESMLTGESKLVFKKVQESVIGGSVNGENSLVIEVQKLGNDSYLSQVINLVKEAQRSKSKTQDLANRAALWLTIVALVGGISTLVIWLLFTDKQFAFAMERAVSVMVITCPHALGLAVPLVVAVSTSLAAKKGILIRNRNAFERSRKIDAIVFDKTGTLTQGKFAVSDIITFDEKEDILKYAAAVEANSEHLIGKAIAASFSKLEKAYDFKSMPGKGAQANVLGENVKVVSIGYLEEHNIAINDSRIKKVKDQGKTIVFVLIDDKIKGIIALEDVLRKESEDVIGELKKMNIRSIMLTGDNDAVAKSVFSQLNLDEYFSEVLPSEKKDKIEEIRSHGFFVGMVGDGVNDAPALAQSDVGIAIGAGTDVAIESADIILVKSNPLDVIALIKLSKVTNKKMVQNLIWATSYNALAIPIAAGIFYNFGVVLNPAVAAIFMSLSTVICAVNAKLLKLK